jgi:hypothetical protein
MIAGLETQSAREPARFVGLHRSLPSHRVKSRAMIGRSKRARQPGAVVVCGLAHARAALLAAQELGVPVVLLSLPSGASSTGAGWFKATVDRARAAYPSVEATAILDCGNRPDLVLGALRHGLKDVVFTGAPAVRRKLEDVAAQQEGRVYARRPAALDLDGVGDPLAACRAWLAGRARHIRKPAD